MKQKSYLTQQSTLKTHLSPQQVRFVRLLEMSGPEIEEAVRHELDENPALEASDSERESEDVGNVEIAERYNETAEELQAADYMSEDDVPSYLLNMSRGTDVDRMTSILEMNQQWPTMVESLNEQLDMLEAPSRDIAMARYLIGYLDDNGRLTRSLSDIAADISIETGYPVKRADLLPGINLIRYELDPPGIGAVDLRECLLIQLQRKEPKTLAIRAAEEIIRNNFDLFTKKHFDRLRTILGVDKKTLDEALAVIRTLDPKPGSSIDVSSGSRTNHVTPDFSVTPVEGEHERFSITLNQHLPELAVEQSFKVDATDKNSQAFIRSKRDEANTFINLIRRRTSTLMAVMKAIVSIQHRFFVTEDKADLRPMILNDITELTGYDRSVISRATSNKYVSTPGGIYSLKMFFNDTPTDDNNTSSSEIEAALQKIIDEEDKKKPLSDKILTERLQSLGYKLARRTVTKYREKMNIPVARLRKEFV